MAEIERTRERERPPIADNAYERNMRLRLPPVQPRSRKAFEAACHARDGGRFDAMHLALFRGFFEDGRDILLVERNAELTALRLAALFEEPNRLYELARATMRRRSDKSSVERSTVTSGPSSSPASSPRDSDSPRDSEGQG